MEPVRIHATIFSLWISKPQEISQRSFIQTASFIIELTGDLPEIIWTLLLVLSVKDATICCTQGQNIYVEKRGENPQGTIKLNPVNNYCKTRQEVKSSGGQSSIFIIGCDKLS